MAARLQVQPQAAKALSPAAQAFNRALQRIEKLQTQLDELEAACRAHQAALAQSVQPLRAQHTAAMRQLLERLCAHLDGPAQGLSKTQRNTLCDIVCGIAITLMEQGVPGMEALHDRHSPQTLAQKRKAQGEALQQAASAPWGGCVEQDEAERQARAEARQARKTARQAKKGATTKQQQAAQALNDADTSLRQLYRQLASALHPDREPDPAEHGRKNALMGEANAAYQRKDLVALLRLQLQAELVDPDHLERLSDERLQHLTLLLKQQAADLDKRRQREQQHWAATFDLPWGLSLKPQDLSQCLNAEMLTWEAAIRGVLADVHAASEIRTLKPWLNRHALRRAAPDAGPIATQAPARKTRASGPPAAPR